MHFHHYYLCEFEIRKKCTEWNILCLSGRPVFRKLDAFLEIQNYSGSKLSHHDLKYIWWWASISARMRNGFIGFRMWNSSYLDYIFGLICWVNNSGSQRKKWGIIYIQEIHKCYVCSLVNFWQLHKSVIHALRYRWFPLPQQDRMCCLPVNPTLNPETSTVMKFYPRDKFLVSCFCLCIRLSYK